MAIKVIELELTHPFPSLQYIDAKHYAKVQILVRKNNHPIGYAFIELVCEASKYQLEEKYLRSEIECQLPCQSAKTLDLASLEYNWPTLTVVICTRGRHQHLRNALESLTKLIYPANKLELLVVDNAPNDDSVTKIVAQFLGYHRVVEPRPGLNLARNYALKIAKGEIVAYVDDDVRVDPLWAKGIAYHFSDPQVGCVTGLVAPAELETAAQQMFEEYGGFGKGFEPHEYSLELARRWDYSKLPRAWRYFPLMAGYFGTGANMALRKSIFDKTRLFDESLGAGTHTKGSCDLEMFYRVIRHGFTLVYEPQALIWHYHRRDMPALRRQIKSWGQGNYAFWTKTFLHDPPMRFKVAQVYVLCFLRRMLWQSLRRRGKIRQLPMVEALGALQGTVTYFIACRETAKLASKARAEKLVTR